MNDYYSHYFIILIIYILKYVWKALPGWIMITRRHAEDLVKLPSIVDPTNKDLVIAWNTVHAPEEVLIFLFFYLIFIFICNICM